MKTLTVFTPTFNRAHLLPRLYRSLCAQTSLDFCWLVVDDGSSDATEALVRGWVKEGLIDIQYAFKPNGGMHTAHNLAYDLIDTELNVCIDSDDLMPPNAVERILARWRAVGNDRRVAGLLGLDEALSGGLVGTSFPRDGMVATLPEVYDSYRVRGDKKVVLRTDIVRALPRYPEFPGERLVPLGSLYTQVGQTHPFLCINEVWAVVDYQPDGSSATVIKQYFQSPRGFRHQAVLNLFPGTTWTFRAKNLLKIELMDLIIGQRGEDVRGNLPRLCLSVLLRPISYPAYLYLRWQAGR